MARIAFRFAARASLSVGIILLAWGCTRTTPSDGAGGAGRAGNGTGIAVAGATTAPATPAGPYVLRRTGGPAGQVTEMTIESTGDYRVRWLSPAGAVVMEEAGRIEGYQDDIRDLLRAVDETPGDFGPPADAYRYELRHGDRTVRIVEGADLPADLDYLMRELGWSLQPSPQSDGRDGAKASGAAAMPATWPAAAHPGKPPKTLEYTFDAEPLAFDRHVTIAPDGRVSVIERQGHPERRIVWRAAGQLTDAERASLAVLTRGWDALAADYPAAVDGAEGSLWRIRYGERAVAVACASDEEPPVFRQVRRAVEDAARRARVVKAPSKPSVAAAAEQSTTSPATPATRPTTRPVRLVTRTYDFRALLSFPDDVGPEARADAVDTLLALLRESIPDRPLEITEHDSLLTVKAPPAAHRLIALTLQQLRETRLLSVTLEAVLVRIEPDPLDPDLRAIRKMLDAAAIRPAPRPAAAAGEPAAPQPETRPATQPATQPATSPAALPASEPASDPPARSAAPPATQPASEAVLRDLRELLPPEGRPLSPAEYRKLRRALESVRGVEIMPLPRLQLVDGTRGVIVAGAAHDYVSGLRPPDRSRMPDGPGEPIRSTVHDGPSVELTPSVTPDRKYVQTDLRASLSNVWELETMPVGRGRAGAGENADADADADEKNDGNAAEVADVIERPRMSVASIAGRVDIPDGAAVVITGFVQLSNADASSTAGPRDDLFLVIRAALIQQNDPESIDAAKWRIR